MPIGILSRKGIVLCAGLVLMAVAITASVLSAPTKRIIQKPQKQVTALPEIISHVPKLRVSNVTVTDLGTPEASAAIEILNTSHLAVMSVDISTKNNGNSGGISVDGLLDPDNPQVVIAPFGTITLHMSFTEMIPNAPLAISAAEFADGTSEGDKAALRELRAARKRWQTLQRAEKKQKEGTQR